jgi:proliferating cell nuclear antigen
MDIDQEHLGIPETEYSAVVTMPAGEFARICRDFSALSESVTIEAVKDEIKFSCQGDIGNGSVQLKTRRDTEDDSRSTLVELREPVSQTFSLKYLTTFCKGGALSERVRLSLGVNVPLLVEYAFQGGWLRYYLAPKIGDDE